MTLTGKIQGSTLIVTALPEFLDAGNAAAFRAEMSRLLGDHGQVIVDMSPVHFIDSAGCGALIAALRHIKASGGTLTVFGAHKQVRRVFELMRMHRIINLFETRQQALDSLRL